MKQVKEMQDYINAMKEQNTALNRQAAELRAENKGDEAVFCTVRANVYDICATVCNVWVQKGDPDACRAIFDRFREEWGAALDSARQQNNAKKQCIEEAKLEALADAVGRFDQARCG